jgi:hypothetical protein
MAISFQVKILDIQLYVEYLAVKRLCERRSLMSTLQFGREMAAERVAQLIAEARAAGSVGSGGARRSARLARTLRRMADYIDPSGDTTRCVQENSAYSFADYRASAL